MVVSRVLHAGRPLNQLTEWERSVAVKSFHFQLDQLVFPRAFWQQPSVPD